MKLYLLLICLSLTFADFIPTGYTEISTSEVDTNPVVEDALQFGVDSILTNLVNSKNIPDTNFQISQIYSIAALIQSSASLYAFEVDLKNSNTLIKSKFIVKVPKSGNYVLFSSSSQISTTTSIIPKFFDVPLSEYESSKLIQKIMQFGLDKIVTKVFEKYENASDSFTVNTMNSVQKATVSSTQVIYKFNLVAQNDDGVNITTAYAVSYNPSTGTKSLLSSSYVVTTTATGNDLSALGRDYFLVAKADVANSQTIPGILSYGVDKLQKILKWKGKIPQNNFVLEQTTNVYRQITATELDYKCEVVLDDNLGTTINGIFVVRFIPGTGEMKLNAFAVTIKTTS